MKIAQSSKPLEPKIQGLPKMTPAGRKIIRRMARLLRDATGTSPGPAHYRISIELNSEEADDVFNHYWHSLEKKRIYQKHQWAQKGGADA